MLLCYCAGRLRFVYQLRFEICGRQLKAAVQELRFRSLRVERASKAFVRSVQTTSGGGRASVATSASYFCDAFSSFSSISRTLGVSLKTHRSCFDCEDATNRCILSNLSNSGQLDHLLSTGYCNPLGPRDSLGTSGERSRLLLRTERGS